MGGRSSTRLAEINNLHGYSLQLVVCAYKYGKTAFARADYRASYSLRIRLVR